MFATVVPGTAHGALQPLLEDVPVGSTGERVVVRPVCQRLRRDVGSRCVAPAPAVAAERALLVEYGFTAHAECSHRAIRIRPFDEAVFERPARCHELLDSRRATGYDTPLRQSFDRSAPHRFGASHAGNLLVAAGEVGVVRLCVRFPKPVGGCLREVLEAQLAAAQRPLGPPAVDRDAGKIGDALHEAALSGARLTPLTAVQGAYAQSTLLGRVDRHGPAGLDAVTQRHAPMGFPQRVRGDVLRDQRFAAADGGRVEAGAWAEAHGADLAHEFRGQTGCGCDDETTLVVIDEENRAARTGKQDPHAAIDGVEGLRKAGMGSHQLQHLLLPGEHLLGPLATHLVGRRSAVCCLSLSGGDGDREMRRSRCGRRVAGPACYYPDGGEK